MKPPDKHTGVRAAIESAVRSAALALLSREATFAEAVAIVAAAMSATVAPSDMTPRERAAAARLDRRERMLAELARLDPENSAHGVDMIVARKFADDPRDPIEVASLARSLRRWRPKKSGHCPGADEIAVYDSPHGKENGPR